MRLAGTLVVAALAAAAAPTGGRAVEFEPDDDGAGPPALAVGPAGRGGGIVSADAGYVRSGVRADLGLASVVDLGFRAELFTTRHGVGEKGFFGGLRWSPASGEPFRLSLAGEAGYVMVPLGHSDREVIAFRSELAAGFFVGKVLPSARVALRALRWDASVASGWDLEWELGAGVERAFGRLLVGAEASAWLQPGLPGLAQWRVRAGWAF